jgi:hypothetical protein
MRVIFNMASQGYLRYFDSTIRCSRSAATKSTSGSTRPTAGGRATSVVPAAAPDPVWDHLTTSGILHVQTTRTLVWSDVQRQGRDLNWVPDYQIVCEAQSLDEHVAELAAVPAAPERAREENAPVEARFARRRELEQPTAELVETLSRPPASASSCEAGCGPASWSAARPCGCGYGGNQRRRQALERPRSERAADAAVKVGE